MRYAMWLIVAAGILGGVAALADESPQDTNQITTLTVDQAKALSQHKGSLSLNGLTTLSDEAANALAQHDGQLSLDGLITLTNAELAAKLATRPQRTFRTMSFRKPFNRLTTLSPEVAQALAQHGVGHLHLNGLTTLSPKAAKALAQYKGGLSFNGLTTLSDEAATALAQHKGTLSLDGPTKFSREAAAALRAHPSFSSKFQR